MANDLQSANGWRNHITSEAVTASTLGRTSSEGVKVDAGKLRWDLLPWRATGAIVRVLTFGASKYAPNNWRQVPGRRERYFAAAQRHMSAWWLGERCDPESGVHHLAHAGCCILFLLSEELGHDD